MKFGLAFASSIGIDHAGALEVCRHTAAAGLAFAAAAAPGLRLGTCILIVPQRNPIVPAKELATLDQLSGGRVNAVFGQQMADPVAGAEQLARLGVGRVMVPAFFFAGPGGLDRLDEFGEQVVRPTVAASRS